MDKKHEAGTNQAQKLIGPCQEAIGPEERVTWAMIAWEGPNPVPRVLALLSMFIPPVAALLLGAAPIVAFAITLGYGLIVGLVTSRIWKNRLVALTDDGAIVLERRSRNGAGAVIGRVPGSAPTDSKDVWRGYEVDGHTTWVSGAALDAYAASQAAETTPA